MTRIQEKQNSNAMLLISPEPRNNAEARLVGVVHLELDLAAGRGIRTLRGGAVHEEEDLSTVLVPPIAGEPALEGVVGDVGLGIGDGAAAVVPKATSRGIVVESTGVLAEGRGTNGNGGRLPVCVEDARGQGQSVGLAAEIELLSGLVQEAGGGGARVRGEDGVVHARAGVVCLDEKAVEAGRAVEDLSLQLVGLRGRGGRGGGHEREGHDGGGDGVGKHLE